MGDSPTCGYSELTIKKCTNLAPTWLRYLTSKSIRFETNRNMYKQEDNWVITKKEENNQQRNTNYFKRNDISSIFSFVSFEEESFVDKSFQKDGLSWE